MSIGPIEGVSVLVAYAAFVAVIVLLIAAIVHCIKHVHPRWVSVLVIAAMVVLPVAGVAVYWLVVMARLARAPKGTAPGWYADPEDHSPTY